MGPDARAVGLPGLDGTGTLFRPLIAALRASERRRVRLEALAYNADTPQTYDDVLTWVRREVTARGAQVIVAESYSGPIGLRLAADPPPGIVAVVLCATFATSPRWALTPATAALAPTALFAQPPTWLAARALLGRSPDPTVRSTLLAALRTPSGAVVRQRVRDIANVDVRAEARTARVPVLYLQAEDDLVVPRRCGRQLAELCPSITLRPLAGPHLLLQTQPTACATAIRRFLAETTALWS